MINNIFTTQSYAHVLQTSGSIGAVLHIDPDDDPIIGQPSYFFFEIKDTTNRFSHLDCICRVSVLAAGKEVNSQSLFQGTSGDPAFHFTFPEKNLYTIQLTGRPIAPASFNSFKFSYDLRVTRNADNKLENTAGIKVFVYLLVGALILTGFIYTIAGKKKSNRKK